jgi:peroxiredoxin
VGEVPLLKDLQAQYKDQEVVVVGISLDEDLKPVQEMVTSKGISWPQVSDADKTLRKLFNVKGTPTYYLLDRDGKIAAKDLPSFKKLSSAIEELLKKP